MKPNTNLNPSNVRGYSRNGITFKARMFLFMAFLALLSFGTNRAQAQDNSETIYKDWHFVGESKTHIDVSAKIAKCSVSSPAQIFLFVFNEGSQSSDIKFTVLVSEIEGSRSFKKEISQTVNFADMVRATCDNKLEGLKIDLPADYNPNNVSITVIFN